MKAFQELCRATASYVANNSCLPANKTQSETLNIFLWYFSHAKKTVPVPSILYPENFSLLVGPEKCSGFPGGASGKEPTC